jgi:hypothetical protein
VNLLKKWEMDVDLPTLFYAVGWSFLGSPDRVEVPDLSVSGDTLDLWK